MIDKEKLRYDLALHSAVVMTLRNNRGNPPDLLLTNFLNAYLQYGEERRDKELNKVINEIAKSE